MADEDYEILPHQLLQDLKYDVEALKKKLTEPDSRANELILEIESMKDAVHDLNDIFQAALEQTKGEDISGTLKTLKEKIEAVVSQNETIARALITISDKVDEFVHHKPSTPVRHQMGPPPMPGMRMAPKPMMPPPLPMPSAMSENNALDDLPPPPPSPPMRRRGLFK